MRIFKTRWLARFARREGISDKALREAIARAERGLIDADLGDGLIKQRVARMGQGRSGGYRMIVGYRMKDRAVFLLGFAKSVRSNLNEEELAVARENGAYWLGMNEAKIQEFLEDGALQEIEDGEENQ
jgi:hypothetical protein